MRDPQEFTPTTGQQATYRTPADARAALGELGQYFTWTEFWRESDVPALGVPSAVAHTAIVTARTYLDPLRAALGRPLRITSWWRPRGRSASAHYHGYGVDFVGLPNRPGGDYLLGMDLAREVERVFAERRTPWDQIIGYDPPSQAQGGRGGHVHVGVRQPSTGAQRREVRRARAGRKDYTLVPSGGSGMV